MKLFEPTSLLFSCSGTGWGKPIFLGWLMVGNNFHVCFSVEQPIFSERVLGTGESHKREIWAVRNPTKGRFGSVESHKREIWTLRNATKGRFGH